MPFRYIFRRVTRTNSTKAVQPPCKRSMWVQIPLGDPQKERGESMATMEEWEKALEKMPAPKKELILSLKADFDWLTAEIEKLHSPKIPRYAVNPKNPKMQVRFEADKILKDYQAQKNDIATKLLKAMEDSESGESPLAKLLRGFEDD